MLAKFVLYPSNLMRLSSCAALVVGLAMGLLVLFGLIPTDTALLRVMSVGMLVLLPFMPREVWRFNVRPAVEVANADIALYSRGRTSRFTSCNVTSISLRRAKLNDYLTLELDSGLVHRLPVQIDDNDHRAKVESWVAKIARATETDNGP